MEAKGIMSRIVTAILLLGMTAFLAVGAVTAQPDLSIQDEGTPVCTETGTETGEACGSAVADMQGTPSCAEVGSEAGATCSEILGGQEGTGTCTVAGTAAGQALAALIA